MRRWLRRWASRQLRTVKVLRIAVRHPGTPWYAKAIGALALIYLISPIDLIPDWIPVLGQLDDIILVPVGLWMAFRLVPRDVWLECREQEAGRRLGRLWKE